MTKELSIEIDGAQTGGLEELRTAVSTIDGLELTNVASGSAVLTPFNEQALELLEETAFSLGVDDASVQPVRLDGEDITPAQDVIDAYNDKNGGTETVYPLNVVNDLLDVANEVINTAVAESNVAQQVGQSEPEPKPSQPEVMTGGDEAFVDDVAPAEKPVETTQTEPETVTPSSETEQPAEQQTIDDPFAGLGQTETKEETAVEPDAQVDETPDADEWHKMAVKIFNESHADVLPRFDPLTHEVLQTEILQAHENLVNAKNVAVDAIAKRLEETHNKALSVVQASSGVQALKDHNATVDDLNATIPDEVNQAVEAVEDERASAKQDYVDKRIADIQKEFDTLFGKVYDAKAEQAKEQATANVNKTIESENERYQNYVDSVITPYVDKHLDGLDVSDILGNYNEAVGVEKEVLHENASAFQNAQDNRVLELTRDLEAKAKQSEDLQRELELTKNSINQTITSQVSKLSSDASVEANGKINDLQDTIAELRQQLRDEQGKSAVLSQNLQAIQARPLVPTYYGVPEGYAQAPQNPQSPQATQTSERQTSKGLGKK